MMLVFHSCLLSSDLVNAFHHAVCNSAASEREHIERVLESTRIAALRVSPRALNATLPASVYGSPSFAALRDNVLSPCTQQNSVLTFKRDPVASRSNSFLLLRHYVSVFHLQQSLRLLRHLCHTYEKKPFASCLLVLFVL